MNKLFFVLLFSCAVPAISQPTIERLRAQQQDPGAIARKFYQQQQNPPPTAGPSGGGNIPDAITEHFFTGAAAGDAFGWSVASAGDVNGDGYSDVIVGAPYNSAGGANAGRAYIYFGGLSFNIVPDVILTGAAAGDGFGVSVASAGDVNGDGYSDVIVGAPYAGGASAGRAYIYFGGASMNNLADVTLTGAAANDQFGRSVASAGDVNGDGYSDVIVGAYDNDAGGIDAGRAYIYFGGTSMDNIADVTMTGAAAGDGFGLSVASAGDLNGDGYSDVIVGALRNSAGGTEAGCAYIYFGGASMNNIADVTMTGAAAGDHFGASVAGAGDVNGDGYSDVIVGAYSNDAGGIDAGRAYIYFGGASMNNIADVTITGAAAGDGLGQSVAGAGDVNGDGYSDVIVGAYGNDAGGIDAGRVYIYFGGASMDNIADVTMTGAATGDAFSFSVASAGDVNGDGYSDVLVGAYSNDAGGTDAGRAYIYCNSLTGTDIPDEFFTGAAAGDHFGYSVASAGDVNGDGYSDVIVGAFSNDVGGIDAGRAYIYFGGPGMDNTPDVILTGAAAGDNFGFLAASAGDVNGDGYSDVIVGAPLNNAGGVGAGRAYIFFGGASMDNTPDVILTGAAAGDSFGFSVASAGDVNGDGYSDVIVGAWHNDAGGVDAGRAYIYFGGASMDNTPDVIMTGETTGDSFGRSVASAGDVNGDGYCDVIVGAYRYSSYIGRAYIFFGGPSMDNTPDVTMTGGAASDNFGVSVASAGDVNGDGYNDVIVGANGYSGYTGRAYIYFGGVSMDNIADVTFTAAAADDTFGQSVASAGDVNGDGYSDVIVGAVLNSAGGLFAGRAYIYFGGASMANTADVTMTGAAAGDQFGFSVASAGDVNGDGYSDVIVGAPYNDAGGVDAGRAYLYRSSSPPIIPRVKSVKDVPNDQGGQVRVQWTRSGYDVAAVARVSEYVLQRSAPPGIGGFVWDYVATIPATHEPAYSTIAAMPADSGASTSGTFYFRVIARGANPAEVWRSAALAGHSADNLAPSAPANASLTVVTSTSNRVKWDRNRSDPDVGNYKVYRSTNPGFPVADTTLAATTTDTTVVDGPLNPGLVYYYRVVTYDVHGNPSQPTGLLSVNGLSNASVKLYLEGPYNTGTLLMNRSLRDGGYLAAHFASIPIPANAVDSINIELRNAASVASSTTRKFKPAWILTDGTIRAFSDTTANYVTFDTLAGNYYLVVRHRNHLAIMTAGVQALNGAVPSSTYDFSTSQSQAYGTNPMKLVGTKYCMYAGDTNASGIVTTADANGVFSSLLASGYNPSDINLSGVVSTADANIIFTNLLISSQVSRPGQVKEEVVPAVNRKSTLQPGNANKENH